MIDRGARDRYAQLLRRFAAGLLSNDEYEEQWGRIATRDPAVGAMQRVIASYHDALLLGCRRGGRALPAGSRRAVARMILFLRSDRSWPWPPRRPADDPPWWALVSGAGGLVWFGGACWLTFTWPPRHENLGQVLLGGVTLALLLSLTLTWLAPRLRGGGEWPLEVLSVRSCWPFATPGDLALARRGRRSLAGR